MTRPDPFLFPFGSPGRAGSLPFPPPQLPMPHSQRVHAMASPHSENFNRAVHVTSPQQFLHPLPLPPPVTGKVASRSTTPVKVKMTEDASLYALARSWLRNGEEEEIQLRPQQKPLMTLPKPLPASPVASDMLNKKEDEEVEKDEVKQEESEKCVDEFTPEQLLKQHVERAKRVKARVREERLRRIKRFRNRIRLLLSLSGDQCSDDTAGGN